MKVNFTPAVARSAIDEILLVINNQDKDYKNQNLTNIISKTLKTQAVIYNQVLTKAYVDQFDQENEQSRRDLGIDFFNESTDLVPKKKRQKF